MQHSTVIPLLRAYFTNCEPIPYVISINSIIGEEGSVRLCVPVVKYNKISK